MGGEGIFVIFGITGDLAKRKLLPALYRLVVANHLSKDFKIIGTTRRDTTLKDVSDAIKDTLKKEKVKVNRKALKKLESCISIVRMDITKTDDYSILKNEVDKIATQANKPVNLLHYLAVPPEMFKTIVDSLGVYKLNQTGFKGAESRLLIEKPFGYDTKSAKNLIAQMEKVFSEKGIYRVDHYLAKETVQNILTFRLQNPLYRSLWNKTAVSNITITAHESISIEGRVNFYEKTGALRDLIQSHLLQLLALITMEEPSKRTSQDIHQRKLALLEAVEQIKPEEVDKNTFRAQYEGYTEEVNNPKSTVETYAAIKLKINNDRWRGVPVLLRTGKGMDKKVTEITLIFKSRDYASKDINALTLSIQPNEGIVLSLLVKEPSLEEKTKPVKMEFFYNKYFGSQQTSSYERVLVDAIKGDKTLFTTDKEVLASWKIVENVISKWSENKSQPVLYEKNSKGPAEAKIFNSFPQSS